MRVFLSGIVAAAATTAVWLGLETAFHTKLAWMACAVELVTGLCVHRLAGPQAGASVARGALAAVLTAGSMAAGIQIVTLLTLGPGAERAVAVASPATVANRQPTNPATPAETRPAQPTEKPPTEQSPADTTSKPLDQPEVKSEEKSDKKSDAQPDASPGTRPAQKPAAASPTQPALKLADAPQDTPVASDPVAYLKWWLGSWDNMWMGLSTLLAYVLGRGLARSPAAESGQQPSPA